MPSPTHKTNKVRRRKRARNGKQSKVEGRQRGTINFFKAFETPAIDEKASAQKSTVGSRR